MLYNQEFEGQTKSRRKKKTKRIGTVVLLLITLMAILIFIADVSGAFPFKKGKNHFNIFSLGLKDDSKEISNEEESEGAVSSINNSVKENVIYIKKQKLGVEKKVINKKCDELKKELEEYISNYAGQYGIYYIDLNTGAGFGINESEEYIAASTVKIPINLYLYKRMEDGTIKAEDTMKYTEEDYEAGTGDIQFKEFGREYSVKELSRLSIVISDNVATNMLIRLVGRHNFKDYMRELGGTIVVYEENTTCPLDMAIYMKEVYTFYMSNQVIGKQLMDCFENTVYNDRIPKLLPKGVRVAHKIGNWPPSAYHDVGIVFADRPYVISIMSKNIENHEEVYQVIANISKKVYDFVSKVDL